MSMRQVTKDEFYAAVGPHNVHPRIVEPWPYTSIFEFPNRREFGRIVPTNGHDTERDYYLVRA